MKVNSLYVESYPLNTYGYELGWFTDPGDDPIVLTAEKVGDLVTETYLPALDVPVGQYSWYAIKWIYAPTGSHWKMYYNSQLIWEWGTPWFNEGQPKVGEERLATTIHGKASFKDIQLGSDPNGYFQWYYWQQALVGTVDDDYMFRNNFVQPYHWLYCDTYWHTDPPQ